MFGLEVSVWYSELLTTGKLNDYLADINEQAEELFSRLVKQLAEKESVTEALKAENQMLWAQKMNNIHNAAMEIVSAIWFAHNKLSKKLLSSDGGFFFREVSKKS